MNVLTVTPDVPPLSVSARFSSAFITVTSLCTDISNLNSECTCRQVYEFVCFVWLSGWKAITSLYIIHRSVFFRGTHTVLSVGYELNVHIECRGILVVKVFSCFQKTQHLHSEVQNVHQHRLKNWRAPLTRRHRVVFWWSLNILDGTVQHTVL
jgi:hypothetical protein